MECIIIRYPKSILSWMVDLPYPYSFSVPFEWASLNKQTFALPAFVVPFIFPLVCSVLCAPGPGLLAAVLSVRSRDQWLISAVDQSRSNGTQTARGKMKNNFNQ